MDEEERFALKLTRQDLEAMLNASEPADVARLTPQREAEFLVFGRKNNGEDIEDA